MQVPTRMQDAALMHVFYLHGFASSAASSKAAWFGQKLRAHGITLQTPDFNEPDFSTLTVTRMVEQTASAIDALPEGPVVLIGSSMGALVAVQAAALNRPRAVDRLVLLAPALDFGRRRDFALGDRTHEEWRTTGHTNVFHYGYGRMLPVHYELYADACGYECENLRLDLPVQIFQGRNDIVVDPGSVEAWARRRPNVELHLLDDDHQLGASLDYMWDRMRPFLGII